MKSLIKMLVAILFATGNYSFLSAQTIGLGIRGGINFATAELETKVDDSWESDYKDFMPLVNVGLISEVGITDMFAVQPEVNFIQKGYKTTYQNGTNYDVKVVMNYIEVPVLVKGSFGAGPFKFNALLGPTFGYTFNGSTEVAGESTDIDYDKDQIKQTDIGAMLGLGFGYDLEVGSIFLDARGSWGFTNLYDSEESDHVNWHNRGISAGIGYIYRFGE